MPSPLELRRQLHFKPSHAELELQGPSSSSGSLLRWQLSHTHLENTHLHVQIPIYFLLITSVTIGLQKIYRFNLGLRWTPCCRFCPYSPTRQTDRNPLLLVKRLYLLNLVIATHKDARPIVDVLGHHLEHAAHLAIDGLATGYRKALDAYPGRERLLITVGSNSPFSNTNAIGAHSYRILSLPLGLFLSAG